MNPTRLRREAAQAAARRKLAYTGPELAAIRATTGLSQTAFAAELKTSLRTVARWEAMGLKPGPESVLYRLIALGRWEL